MPNSVRKLIKNGIEYGGIFAQGGIDISDTTAQAADVASGKVFYTADGTRTTGSATIGWISIDDLATNVAPSGDIVLGNIAVGDYALAYKSTITSLSGDVTAVGASAFTYCSSIKSISFPNMTGQFLQAAARDCRALEFADLGGCRQINSTAFQNAMSLTEVVLRSSSVCTLQNVSAFVNTPIRGYHSGSGTIYVPSSLISSYQTASNWSTIYNEGHCTFAAIEGSQYEL